MYTKEKILNTCWELIGFRKFAGTELKDLSTINKRNSKTYYIVFKNNCLRKVQNE